MTDLTIDRILFVYITPSEQRIHVRRVGQTVRCGTGPDLADLGTYQMGVTTITGSGPVSVEDKAAIFARLSEPLVM
jgi:hypothetical protein